VIVDLDHKPPADQALYDVCIVGAGAAGIALAVELRRKGRRVLILEGGGARFEPASQALYAGQAEGLAYAGLTDGRYRVLGGTTTQWGGQILEIDEAVFGPRPWTPNPPWPFPKTELARHYRRALEIEGLETALENADELWRAMGLAKPEFGRDLVSAFSRWCPQTNFATLHAQALRDPAVSLYLHANLEALDFAEDGRTVRAVRCRSLGGHTATFKASAVVLCVGGIESSRFLLQAAAPLSKGGAPVAPWRGNPWIGRGFQDHISAAVATITGCRLTPLAGYFDYRAVRGHRYHPKMVLAPDAQARLGVLDICGTVSATTDGSDDLARVFATLRLVRTGRVRLASVGDLMHLARHLPALLWQKLPLSRSAVGAPWEGRTLRLWVHCEQTPESGGRVSLGDERDALGRRRANVAWRAGAAELDTIRAYLKTLGEAFADHDLGQIIPDPGVMDDDEVLRRTFVESFHHIGGARMAASADEGVVAADLKLFGCANAYVCGSAVFPSAGYVNPTHTIVALACRLAEHLAGA
jgi:choline dehydrogenase-like flavoprotein